MALVIIINNAIVKLGGVNIRAVSLGKCELYTSLHRATSPMTFGQLTGFGFRIVCYAIARDSHVLNRYRHGIG